MPSFTQSLPQQNQASAAGNIRLPQSVSFTSGASFGDEFNRKTLNPTNAIPYYVSTITAGSGTNVIAATADKVTMSTSGAVNDNQELRLTELAFERQPYSAEFDTRTTFTIDIIFHLAQTTTTRFFIGLYTANGATLSALPGTTVHMGLYYDSSLGTNFVLTSADGATNTTTDAGASGAANSTHVWRLNISWTGLNGAILSLYDNGTTASAPVTSSTLVKQQTVTALGSVTTFNLDAFLQTLATAVKTVSFRGWKATVS